MKNVEWIPSEAILHHTKVVPVPEVDCNIKAWNSSVWFSVLQNATIKETHKFIYYAQLVVLNIAGRGVAITKCLNVLVAQLHVWALGYNGQAVCAMHIRTCAVVYFAMKRG